jgi:hypothetical protein
MRGLEPRHRFRGPANIAGIEPADPAFRGATMPQRPTQIEANRRKVEGPPNVPRSSCLPQLRSIRCRNHKPYYTTPPTRSEGAKAPLSTLASSLVTTRCSLRCSSESLLASAAPPR